MTKNSPTTPHMQHLPAITHMRFSLIRFRSPLLTESQLFSLPMGTKMFHFPTFPPTPLYIQDEVAGHNSGHLRGFPIRTSTDQSSFTNSPWLIAGYNVLHRLLMPRHPPTALSSLSPKKIQHKQNYKDARVHYTILKQHTPHHQHHNRCQQHEKLRPPPLRKSQNPTTRLSRCPPTSHTLPHPNPHNSKGHGSTNLQPANKHQPMPPQKPPPHTHHRAWAEAPKNGSLERR